MPAATQEPEVDPYELLGITAEATEAEIRRAYRQRSLKVHPDRNPNNPDAAAKFHELNTAYSLLLDPLRRLAIDNNLRVRQARTARFSAFEGKRKEFQRELEEREREFKKQRVEKEESEQRKREEADVVMEQGRRMMEERKREAEREVEMRRRQEEEGKEKEDAGPVLGDLDTTVRLKWTAIAHPELTTPASLEQLLSRFGPIDVPTTVLFLKSSKNPDKPAKHATALVPFQRIGDAVKAVSASGKGDMGLEGVEVSWAEGKEPQIVGWLRRQGQLGVGAGAEKKEESRKKVPVVASSKPTQPAGKAFEASVLQRMKEIGRAKAAKKAEAQAETTS